MFLNIPVLTTMEKFTAAQILLLASHLLWRRVKSSILSFHIKFKLIKCSKIAPVFIDFDVVYLINNKEIVE